MNRHPIVLGMSTNIAPNRLSGLRTYAHPPGFKPSHAAYQYHPPPALYPRWAQRLDPKTNQSIIQAIKTLRSHFGETQEEFGKRLGLSKRAITNYEIDRRPAAIILARLAGLAVEVRMDDLVNVFMRELGKDLFSGCDFLAKRWRETWG